MLVYLKVIPLALALWSQPGMRSFSKSWACSMLLFVNLHVSRNTQTTCWRAMAMAQKL